MFRFLLFLIMNGAVLLPLLASPIIREPGAIYLSEISDTPLRVNLKKATLSYFNSDLARYAGTLRFPQSVEVQAILGELLQVRGLAQQGQVVAWIPREAVEGLSPEFLAELQMTEKHRNKVAELIKNNEVAIGMSLEEVKRSIGKPQKTKKRATEEATQDVWEYIRYKNVPQQTIVNTIDGPMNSVIYVKVPDGTMSIFATNGIVTSIEQTEGTMVTNGSLLAVPPLIRTTP